MRSLKVKLVKLHSTVWMGKELGTTLGDPQKHKGMEILYTAEGLFVTFDNQTIGVPHAACACYSFADPKAVAEYLKDSEAKPKVISGVKS